MSENQFDCFIIYTNKSAGIVIRLNHQGTNIYFLFQLSTTSVINSGMVQKAQPS
jgi:hypothetical protein